MSMNNNLVKYGLAVGAGVALGAVGVMLFSRGKVDLKKSLATILSHGMDLKDQAADMMEHAKENFDDIAAEARNEQAKRHGTDA